MEAAWNAGSPIAGWFWMVHFVENPRKSENNMDDLGGPPCLETSRLG